MEKLYSSEIKVGDTLKTISVFNGDVTAFHDEIDILTTSAFVGSYAPTPNTVFKALNDCGINVKKLSSSPEFDLRTPCHIWLSGKTDQPSAKIRRIGCIEFIGSHIFPSDEHESEQSMLNSIRAYFQMLDMASFYGIEMNTIALPLLGSGCQNISYNLLLIPLINECLSFLKRNHEVKNIYFIEMNPQKAALIARSLENSLRFSEADPIPKTQAAPTAFISYASSDKNIADNLCSKLEQNGIKVWYAPRDVKGAYASSIVQAIDAASHFIVILSENSISSEHVLNEIDLAFQHLPNKIKFKPLRIDSTLFTPSFKYYLSRQHWMDATNPPLEERLSEFVSSLLSESI